MSLVGEHVLSDLRDERDEARRVAVSLEADLARILNAWDASYVEVSPPMVVAPTWYAHLNAAIAAAREWVGTDTPLAEHAASLAPHPDQP